MKVRHTYLWRKNEQTKKTSSLCLWKVRQTYLWEKKKKKNKTNKSKENKQTHKKNIDRDYIINRGRDYLSMQKPSSLPSLRERSGALDRRVHWETQETPVAQSHLSASVCITAYRRSGCRRVVKNRFCPQAPNPRLNY